MKSTLISISLFLTLLMPLIALNLWFQYQKKQIRRQVKHQIIDQVDREDLVRFEFSEEEIETKLEWKHSKEFRYQGEMYDVVERIPTENGYIFYCWWDNKETNLYKKLDRLLADYLGGNSERNQNKLSFFRILKLLYHEDFCLNFGSIHSEEQDYFTYQFHLKTYILEQDLEPPQA